MVESRRLFSVMSAIAVVIACLAPASLRAQIATPTPFISIGLFNEDEDGNDLPWADRENDPDRFRDYDLYPSPQEPWTWVDTPFRYVQKHPYETAEWTIIQPGASEIRVHFGRTDFRYSRPDAFEDQKSKIEIIEVWEDGGERVVRVIRENFEIEALETEPVRGNTVKIRYTAGANGGNGYWPDRDDLCRDYRSADTFEVRGYSYVSPAAAEEGDELEVPITIEIPYEPRKHDVHLLNDNGHVALSEPELFELKNNCCLADLLDGISGAAGSGDDGGNDDIRAFRDNFMEGSVEGRRWKESYYSFGGELITICTEDLGLAKKATLLLNSVRGDLDTMMKYGDPALSPLDPRNLKLVSEETIDEGMDLISEFKARGSPGLKKELANFEKAVFRGLEWNLEEGSPNKRDKKRIMDTNPDYGHKERKGRPLQGKGRRVR